MSRAEFYEPEKLKKEVDSIKEDVKMIRDNNIPHIHQRLERLEKLSNLDIKFLTIFPILTIFFACLAGFCFYIGNIPLAIGALGPMGASLVGAIGLYRKNLQKKK